MSVDKKQYSHTNRAGVTYWLFSKEVTLRGGKKQLIYFFRKDRTYHNQPVSGWANRVPDLPHQFKVQENPRNGFLTLVRKTRTRNFAEDEED